MSSLARRRRGRRRYYECMHWVQSMTHPSLTHRKNTYTHTIQNYRCEGIGITTGIDWGWEPSILFAQLHPSPFLKIFVTVVLTVSLSLLKQKIKHPILTPLFFLMIPLVFYGGLKLVGVSVDEARESGWLFSFATPVGGGGGSGGAIVNSNSNSTIVDGGMGGGGAAAADLSGVSASSLGILEECRSFPGVLACLDLRLIAWDVVPSQLFTFLGLVFFR